MTMSLHCWLQNLRSALASSQRLRERRNSPRTAVNRLSLEVLDDRVTPSLLLVSFTETLPQGPIDWSSPAPYWATADFNSDGRLDYVAVEEQYWEGFTLLNVALGNPTGGFSLWQSDY